MRVTQGKYVRRFVYGMAVGQQKVKRVMMGGRQVWPGNELRVRQIILNMLPVTYGANEQYWLHAMDAVAAKSSPDCYVGFNIAGREYRVRTTYGVYPLVRLEYGVLDFGADGPLWEDVRVGDHLNVEVVIPARKSDTYTDVVEAECPLPWLSGTRATVQWHKGRKKKQAGVRWLIEGGHAHLGGLNYTDAHKRRTFYREVPEDKHKWVERVQNGAMVSGVNSLKVTAQPHGAASEPGVTLRWPAFRKVFRFYITGVTKYEPGV